MIFRRYPGVLFVLVASISGCSGGSGGDSATTGAVPPPPPQATVTIDIADRGGRVSPNLTGVNAAINKDTDGVLANNPHIEANLAAFKSRLMRWPGGNQTDTYHWEEPDTPVWKDAWETDPGSDYYAAPTDRNAAWQMDINEYLAHVSIVGGEPIIGINIESGRRYDRMQDSIDEAIRLMQHVEDAGFDVRYWYIDNEPFDITGVEYGLFVNQIVPAMKAQKADINIIANVSTTIQQGTYGWNQTVDFMGIAGHNIDILDVHLYWAWTDASGKGTFTRFVNQNPLLYDDRTTANDSYVTELADARTWLDDNGYGHVELASLEWNVGKSTSPDWSPYKISLVQAEMMMQFTTAGLTMANLWPRYNAAGSQNPVFRGSFDPSNNYGPRPTASILELFSRSAERDVVRSESSLTYVPVLATYDETNEELLVYVLNKSANTESIVVSTGQTVTSASALAHAATNIDALVAERRSISASIADNTINIELPAYSLVLVTAAL